MSTPSTLGGINQLPRSEKRTLYGRVIPPELLDRFHLSPFLVDKEGHDLLELKAKPGRTSVEMSLYHEYGFPDPILYGHITDTINGKLHVLLYILNDPEAPRFDVDRLPDGTPTRFGIRYRNIEAETAAMEAGLNPGQIRRGPRLLSAAMRTFEAFVEKLGHDLYFAEPLYYHNAVIFERYGFTYQQGRRRMESYDQGFKPGGQLHRSLDGSTPFRQPGGEGSIRLRSWAIHDGILGVPFTDVTMYKRVGKHAGISTTDCGW
jgi:acetoin utilization protein AcuC